MLLDKSVLHSVIARHEPDLVLHTVDGGQVLGHSLILSLHSHHIAELIAGIEKQDMIGITMEANYKQVRQAIETVMEDKEDNENRIDNPALLLLGIAGKHRLLEKNNHEDEKTAQNAEEEVTSN